MQSSHKFRVQAETEIPVGQPDLVASDSISVDVGVRGSSLFGSFSNSVNSIVGGGILGLPYAVSQIGWATGVLMYVFSIVMTFLAMHLIWKISTRLGGDRLSFGVVAARLNKYFPAVADLLMMLITFMMSVFYLTVIGDYMSMVGEHLVDSSNLDSVWTSRRFYLGVIWASICVPLSIPRKLTILQYSSTLALLFILYVVVLSIVYLYQPTDTLCSNILNRANMTSCTESDSELCCFEGFGCCLGPVDAFLPEKGSTTDIFSAFPQMLVSFGFSPQAFAIYNDLVRPTIRRLDTVTLTAISTVLAFYTTISIAGYFTYGSEITDNLLGSYPLTTEVTIARVGISFVLCVSYPLLMIPCTESMTHFVGTITSLTTGKNITDLKTREGKLTYYICLVVGLVGTLFIGLLELELSFILTLVGAVSVSNLSFTLPGIFYFFLFKEDGWTLTRIMSLPLAAFGILVMILSLYFF